MKRCICVLIIFTNACHPIELKPIKDYSKAIADTVFSPATPIADTVFHSNDTFAIPPHILVRNDSIISNTDSVIVKDNSPDSTTNTYTGVNTSKQPSDTLTIGLCRYCMLALGDSYTVGQGVAPTESYPWQLTDTLRKLGYDFAPPTIIARSGWRTDQILQALATKSGGYTRYDVVFLLAGVNNQVQNIPIDIYKAEFDTLVVKALNFTGNQPERVYVLSIPDYGHSPFLTFMKPTISAGIDTYNQINQSIASKHGVNYVYITSISRTSNLAMFSTDKLHPSAMQYKMWVNKIIPALLPVISSSNK